MIKTEKVKATQGFVLRGDGVISVDSKTLAGRMEVKEGAVVEAPAWLARELVSSNKAEPYKDPPKKEPDGDDKDKKPK